MPKLALLSLATTLLLIPLPARTQTGPVADDPLPVPDANPSAIEVQPGLFGVTRPHYFVAITEKNMREAANLMVLIDVKKELSQHLAGVDEDVNRDVRRLQKMVRQGRILELPAGKRVELIGAAKYDHPMIKGLVCIRVVGSTFTAWTTLTAIAQQG